MAGIASIALIALTVAVSSRVTVVDTPPPQDARARLSAIIRSFDSSDLAERLDASQRVATDPELTLTLLEESFRVGGGLSAEQLLRLEQAAFARFCLESRAAMGVQYSQVNTLTDGVEISAPLDGFDSMRVLQPGDLIRKLDSTPVRRQNDLRAAILSYSPGDEVAVEVVRRGEPLAVRLRMGNFDHLDARNVGAPAGAGPRLRPQTAGRAGLDARTLQRAWTVRRQRLGGGLADAATPVVLAPMPRQAAAAIQARVEAFGEGRVQNGRLVRIDPADAGGSGTPERIAAGGGSDRDGFVSPPAVFAAGVVSLEHDARAVQLAQKMARTQVMLERRQQLAQQPGLPADARKAIEDDVAQLKAQLAELSELQRKLTLEPQRDNADLIVP